jgi:F0F1-type ATP synthase membrane subunit b/b'
MVFLAFAGSAVQLVPDGSILVHIGMILVMIWVLNRTFFKPIAKVIGGRDARKGGGRGPAAEILDAVGEKEAKYSAEIRETRLKGYEAVKAERDGSMLAKSEAVGAAKHEAGVSAAMRNAELEKQTAEAREAIASEADKLADRIAAGILKA